MNDDKERIAERECRERALRRREIRERGQRAARNTELILRTASLVVDVVGEVRRQFHFSR